MNVKKALSLLELKDNPTEEEIKKAYRRKAMQFHPDKNKGDKASEEKFKQISEAYQTLTNPTSSNGANSFSRSFEGRFNDGSVFEAFMDNLFNTKASSAPQKKHRPGAVPHKLPDLDLGVFNFSLKQALLREAVTIKIHVQAICPNCYGLEGMWRSCKKCGQVGEVLRKFQTPQGFTMSSAHKCVVCKGHGWVRTKSCSICKNKIIYNKSKEIKLKLPTGFKLGQRVCIRGEGCESWMAQSSNIYVVPNIDIPDLSNLSEADKKVLGELISNENSKP